MGDYASKGVAGTGLGLGIAGTALALLNNGNGLGGLLGGNQNLYITAMAQKDAEIGELKAEKYTDNKVDALALAMTNRINDVAADLAQLSLNNERRIGQLEGQVSCLAQSTNTALAGITQTISGITKLVVPAAAVCPEVMPRYNSFVTPASTTTPATN